MFADSSPAVQHLSSRGQELLFHEELQVQLFVLQVQAQKLLHHRPAPVSNTHIHACLFHTHCCLLVWFFYHLPVQFKFNQPVCLLIRWWSVNAFDGPSSPVQFRHLTKYTPTNSQSMWVWFCVSLCLCVCVCVFTSTPLWTRLVGRPAREAMLAA